MLPLLAEVTFSTESLAVAGSVLATVGTAVVWLWRIDIERVQDQVRDLRGQRDRMFSIIVAHGLKSELDQCDRPDSPDTPPAPSGPPGGGPPGPH